MNINYQYRTATFHDGIIYLLKYPYGYTVQVHEFHHAGYIVNKTYSRLEPAMALFEKLRDEYKSKEVNKT